MFGFNMNVNNPEDQAVTREMHSICDKHPACIGCLMESGDVIEIMGKKCCCVTAAMKVGKGGDLS